jgi:putative hydrolase of the HAD superfamily
MALEPVRAVAFDLDDTLCAYWDAAKAGLAETFVALSPTSIAPAKMLRAWAVAFQGFCPKLRELGYYERYLESGAITRNELMRRALLELGIDDPHQAAILGDAYAARRRARLKLFPEIPSMLAALHGRLPLALITNGPADVQREEIQDLGLSHTFDLILIEGEQKLGKPHPDVLAKAERHFKAKPHEMLFVGNSYHHDIAPAIRAGWQTVWVRRPSDVPPSYLEDEKGAPEELPSGAPAPTLTVGDLGALPSLILKA